MPKETEPQDSIGHKMPNLVKPRNEVSYTIYGCPENYVPDWTTCHIEAALLHGPYPLENLSANMAALHAKSAEKIKMDVMRWCGMGTLRGTPQ